MVLQESLLPTSEAIVRLLVGCVSYPMPCLSVPLFLCFLTDVFLEMLYCLFVLHAPTLLLS